MNTLLSSPRRLVVALVAAGALGATGAGLITAREVRAQAGMPAAAAPAPLSASVAMPDFSQITRRYGSTVVNISISGMRQVSVGPDTSDTAGDDNDADSMQQFLRRFQQQFGGSGASMQVPVRGQGSGFIVSEEAAQDAQRQAQIAPDTEVLPLPFHSGAQLLAHPRQCRRTGPDSRLCL
mgnify:CR=1 FL=1